MYYLLCWWGAADDLTMIPLDKEWCNIPRYLASHNDFIPEMHEYCYHYILDLWLIWNVKKTVHVLKWLPPHVQKNMDRLLKDFMLRRFLDEKLICYWGQQYFIEFSSMEYVFWYMFILNVVMWNTSGGLVSTKERCLSNNLKGVSRGMPQRRWSMGGILASPHQSAWSPHPKHM